jgi:LCP family protein required for cell wall assembly
MFIFYLFFLPFILGGLYFGYVFAYNTGLISHGSSSITTGVPPVPILGQDTQAWSGKDRLNILLLGLDQRDDEAGQPSRSDTLIILTIDPVNKTAGMLSIPRDLWVSIPGERNNNKINTAHFFGETQKKGNGPLLAKKTIEQNFGIPIHYYARVNFRGFEKLVDAIGGVDIDAPKPVMDEEYPLESGGIKRLYVPAGWQHMDGQLALEYARSRHADNDFGRSRRQQQVLVAAKDKALQMDMWPKLPSMLGILKDNVTTDIPVSNMLPIAQLIKEIDSSKITNESIDGTMVKEVNNPDMYYLEPVWSEIRPMVAKMFAPPSGQATEAAESNATANIEVLNGTTKVGVASQTSAYLKDKGFVIVRFDNADQNNIKETSIIDRAGKTAAAKNVAKLLGVPNAKITKGTDQGDGVELTVVLGSDATLPERTSP